MNNITQFPNTIFYKTIGEIPTSYLVSLTYEEQLLWLSNYLEKTIIPTFNELLGAVKDYTDKINSDITKINEDMEALDESVTLRLDEFMQSVTSNLTDIVDYKIAHGEIQIALTDTYDSENESLVLSLVAEDNE